VRILWPMLLLVGCGCAPVGSPADRKSPAPPADAVESAAVEFRTTLFRELSQRAAKASESDPGDWQKAAEAWREQQIEARRIANERLEKAILDAAGEQAAWDRERWRSILQSLARGWGDE
jgi:hypothetical protein